VKKLIITAALVGGGVTPTHGPYNPITPDDIAREAKRVEDAGAATVHIHPRNPKTGEPTTDTGVYREILQNINDTTNLVICPTTGLARGVTVQERIAIVPLVEPEIASHDIGCMDGTREKIIARTKEWKYDWEKPYLERYKTECFITTQSEIEWMAEEMQKVGTKPEYELFDVGWINTLSYLHKNFDAYCTPPLWIQFVTGYFGKIPTSPEHVIHMKRTADDLLGKDSFEWQVIGIGYPAQFQVAALAMIMGGHCRVGLEDNLYMEKGVLAKSNAEQVERVVKIARELGREIATPDEAREILKLKGKDTVKL
jgi:uncharacterized protein (DUF849 family)